MPKISADQTAQYEREKDDVLQVKMISKTWQGAVDPKVFKYDLGLIYCLVGWSSSLRLLSYYKWGSKYILLTLELQYLRH